MITDKTAMITEKTVTIDGRPVRFRATARTPRLYRVLFGRDMLQDMQKLQKAFSDRVKDGGELSGIDLTLFENVSYAMAKHADPEIQDSPDEWLDTFGMFSIYEILPEILELWKASTATLSDPKKK